MRWHPHERHPGVSLQAPLGGTQRPSVANLTRCDGEEFMSLASQLAIRPNVTAFALSEAQSALDALRAGSEQGAIAIQVGTSP